MKNTPLYSIERYPLGWLICGPAGTTGLPIEALRQSEGLFPRGAVIAPGIAHHYRASGHLTAQICVVTPSDHFQWREAIERSLDGVPPQEQWWRGCDVGSSAAAIFAVFCDESYRATAKEYSRQSTPLDAADFGRCVRLLQKFPEWKTRLSEVASAYPGTKWPVIVERWDAIENAPPEEQYRILQSIPAAIGAC